ncbi:hypothetical protein HKX48_007377 [Thoreauomyces humboldtii]|nr:hypothetical protein HKX48_007377 [Thoreauomyces humboldtii]
MPACPQPPSYALESPAYSPSSPPIKISKKSNPLHASIRLPSQSLNLSPKTSDHLNDFMRWGIAPPVPTSSQPRKRVTRTGTPRPAPVLDTASFGTPAHRAGLTDETDRTHFNNFVMGGWAPPSAAVPDSRSMRQISTSKLSSSMDEMTFGTPAHRAGIADQTDRAHFNNFVMGGWAPPSAILSKPGTKKIEVDR